MKESSAKEAIDVAQFGIEILENMKQGIGIVPMGEHRLVYTNPAFNYLFGYKAGELTDQTIDLLIPEDIFEEDLRLVQEFVEGEGQVYFNTLTPLRKLKDGTIKPFHIQLNKIQIKDQFYLIAMVNDYDKADLSIKKRKATDFFLKQAEELANIGHFEVDINSQKISLSQEMKALLDLPPDQPDYLEPDEVHNFIHPDDINRIREAYSKGIQHKCVIDLSFRVITANGEEKIIHNTASINNLDSNDQPRTILGMVHNITSYIDVESNLRALNKELEARVLERTKELEKSQKLYKLIAQNFPNGEINVFDRNFNYVFVEGLELFKRGITSENLIGTSFLDRLDEKIREPIEVKLKKVLAGENCSFEIDNMEKTFMIYAVGLKDINNEINQILMVSQNITNLKKVEKETQKLLEKEQHLNELKSRFVSMASHEFRTPLTTINNSLSLLAKYIESPENKDKLKKHIDRLRKSVHHLSNILNDFLSIDKLVTGKVSLNMGPINISEVINEVILDLEVIKKKDQKISFKMEGSEEIIQDEHLLKNVLNNLLSNSIKYSHDHDHILVEGINHNGILKITVEDHGIGIPEAEQSQMFERFFRAKNAKNIQGTGLGLSIVKQYMDQINGKVAFESIPDEKTKFTVEIPLS